MNQQQPRLSFDVDSFGDVTVDSDGTRLHPAQVIRNVVEQAVVAERLGIDAFGLGEHHRADFAVSSPDTVLAAIAVRTERMTLGTAVTVLSSDDPVRLYERFATLDALSEGRAELTLDRGSFTESFPLFGYRLDDYEELFEEKLGLMRLLLGEGPVRWHASSSGRTTPPCTPRSAASGAGRRLAGPPSRPRRTSVRSTSARRTASRRRSSAP